MKKLILILAIASADVACTTIGLKPVVYGAPSPQCEAAWKLAFKTNDQAVYDRIAACDVKPDSVF